MAIVAFLAKSRLVFAFGFIGCCLSIHPTASRLRGLSNGGSGDDGGLL
ncbi:MAG: hypothetical protein WED34_20800 [Planctomycetales bacterium]